MTTKTPETIAAYGDGSGQYTVRWDGELLTIEIRSHAGVLFETIVQRATPAEIEEDWTDWMLSDRFGSCPDFGGPEGAALIDGRAYELEYVRAETSPETEEHDRAVFEREEIRLVLEQYPGATEADARLILGWTA